MNQLFLNFEAYANFSAAIIVEPIALCLKKQKRKKSSCTHPQILLTEKNIETSELRNSSPQEMQISRFQIPLTEINICFLAGLQKSTSV